MYSQDLDDAKVILDNQIASAETLAGPFLNKNMPKTAGSLQWSQQLRARLESGMKRLKSLDEQ